jgi:hypothetical protein
MRVVRGRVAEGAKGESQSQGAARGLTSKATKRDRERVWGSEERVVGREPEN